MSREIDKLPEPEDRRKKKLIIASCSRTGTLSLYFAVKALGYHPYHFAEMVMNCGASHMRIMSETVIASNNRLSGIKRYDREDIDKWLANYNYLIEVPSYLGTRVFAQYATDPDIKFILTERDPDAWVRSVNNTAGENVKIASKFPISILKYFHKDLRAFFRLNQLVYWVLSDITNTGDPDNEANLRRNYVEYIQAVKQVLPEDRTLVVKLEDGLGWEQICPFLGVPIPKEDYPPPNNQKMFEELRVNVLEPWARAAMIKLGTLAVSTLGVAGYFGWRHYRG